MKISVFVFMSLIFVGCNQEFRSPLCTNYLKDIPEDFLGTYKVNIQQFGSSDFKTSGGQEAYMYLTKLSVFTSSLPQVGSTDIEQTKFCEYGSDILVENRSSAGLYSYSMISNNGDGLYISPLVLKSNTSLKLVSIPKVKVWENGEWISGLVINLGDDRVVDNSGVAPHDVLTDMTSSSIGLFYEKVKVKTISKSIKWKMIKNIND